MTLNGITVVILHSFSEFDTLGAHCVKVVEDIPKFSTTEMYPIFLVFSDISLTMI